MQNVVTILNKINIPIILWKHNPTNNQELNYNCYFHNNLLSDVKPDLELSKYNEKNKNIFEDKFNKLIEFHIPQEIIHDNKKIVIDFIDSTNDLIYEIHYTKNNIMGINNNNLLSTISLKIRSPLTNIMGILSIYDELDINSEQKKYMTILKNSTSEILGIANDIIDIYNLQNGNLQLSEDIFSLEEILMFGLNIIKTASQEKNINTGYSLSNEFDLPEKIITDKYKLGQILINLLRNSLKFTEYGKIFVNASLFKKNNLYGCPFPYYQVSPPYYNILFKVKDTGIGIDENKKSIIELILDINSDFDACSYTNKVKPYKFTGFGLIIAKYLCSLMNGHIWFRTINEIGTVFYFNVIVKKA
jgi:Signal transduction histidine kinase